MADDGSAQSTSTQMWPLPSFYFQVTVGSQGVMSFSEVSGLETEYDVIEYRAGDSKAFTKMKMPGLRKISDVTLKKGIFKGDKKLWTWLNSVKFWWSFRVNWIISKRHSRKYPVWTYSFVQKIIRMIRECG